MRWAVPPWLLSRLLVVGALVAAWYRPPGLSHTGDVRPSSGVLVWDAGWYAAIAREGYPDDVQGLRFFPLVPLLGRLASLLTLGNVTAGLLLVANVAALVYLVLLVRLTLRELKDQGAARRVAWLAALAPGAGVLLLPYTEPVAAALAVGMFLCLRERRLPAAAALGFLSGLTRPTGVLLAVPAALELLRDRPRGAREWISRLLTVASPLLGTACYLFWCGLTRGDPMLPYSVQTSGNLRGGYLVNPFDRLFHNSSGGLDWRLTLLLLAVAGALLVVVARTLPIAYTAWALVMVAAAVTSTHQHSVPRYLANTFPLLMAAALVTHRRRVFVAATAACAAFMTGLAYAGFTPTYIL